MAVDVPLKWTGSFCSFGGPLGSGDTHKWWAAGDPWGQFNRFYLFSVFSDGAVEVTLGVRNIRHYQHVVSGHTVNETWFDIHNYGSSAPANYYFYIAWSDPINI